MSTKLVPLSDHVVAIKEAAKTKTESGILLGEAKTKPNIAHVLATGKDVKEVKIGDRVVYKNYEVVEITIEEKKFLVLKEESILTKLEDEK